VDRPAHCGQDEMNAGCMYSFFRKTIPIGSAQNSRSLSLIFSVLIFLLSFVAACVFTFSHGFHNWGSSNSLKLTVEIPVNVRSSNEHASNVERIVVELKSAPGITNVQRVDPEKLKTMLKVWTGDTSANIDFPIPTLLDVEFDSAQPVDIDTLKQRLRTISPDVTVENHNSWAQKLMIFGRSLKLVTILIGSFILFCAAVIVILVTKSALQAYYSTLDILRLLGAKDSYIAKIFQNQVLKSSFYGGLYGVLFAVPAVYAFMIVIKRLGLEGLHWNAMLWRVVAVVATIPFAVALLGVIVSKVTVLVHLRILDGKTRS
jgi:cell division transport system permease protein